MTVGIDCHVVELHRLAQPVGRVEVAEGKNARVVATFLVVVGGPFGGVVEFIIGVAEELQYGSLSLLLERTIFPAARDAVFVPRVALLDIDVDEDVARIFGPARIGHILEVVYGDVDCRSGRLNNLFNRERQRTDLGAGGGAQGSRCGGETDSLEDKFIAARIKRLGCREVPLVEIR